MRGAPESEAHRQSTRQIAACKVHDGAGTRSARPRSRSCASGSETAAAAIAFFARLRSDVRKDHVASFLFCPTRAASSRHARMAARRASVAISVLDNDPLGMLSALNCGTPPRSPAAALASASAFASPPRPLALGDVAPAVAAPVNAARELPTPAGIFSSLAFADSTSL